VTSVDNLVPLCARHAASKGDQPYNEWLAAVRQEDASLKQDEPKFEITITSHEPAPEAPVVQANVPAGTLLPLAAFLAPVSVQTAKPGAKPLAELKQAVPFLRGPAGRIVLDYDWRMKKSGLAHVFLVAWPRGETPDISLLGGPKFPGLVIAKDHLGVKDETGNAQLELSLPGTPLGRWVAGVAVLDEGCDFELVEYALAATN